MQCTNPLKKLERAMGFEPTTPTLARLCSTPELRPLRLRSTAARRIWRKAKSNARLIPARSAAGRMRGAARFKTSRMSLDGAELHCLSPRLSLSRSKATETTSDGGGTQ